MTHHLCTRLPAPAGGTLPWERRSVHRAPPLCRDPEWQTPPRFSGPDRACRCSVLGVTERRNLLAGKNTNVFYYYPRFCGSEVRHGSHWAGVRCRQGRFWGLQRLVVGASGVVLGAPGVVLGAPRPVLWAPDAGCRGFRGGSGDSRGWFWELQGWFWELHSWFWGLQRLVLGTPGAVLGAPWLVLGALETGSGGSTGRFWGSGENLCPGFFRLLEVSVHLGSWTRPHRQHQQLCICLTFIPPCPPVTVRGKGPCAPEGPGDYLGHLGHTGHSPTQGP